MDLHSVSQCRQPVYGYPDTATVNCSTRLNWITCPKLALDRKTCKNLYFICRLNCLGEVKFSCEDTQQMTPFHCAVISNHGDVARLLLQAGSALWEDVLLNCSQTNSQTYRERMISWSEDFKAQPRELYLIVRLYLRKRLGQPFWNKVNKLPLPTQLKLSLALPEFTS